MVRFKRRYIVFRMDWEKKPQTFNAQHIVDHIQSQISQSFGDFGAGLSQGQIISFSS